MDDATDHVAAADVVIASTGNTTCQQILAAGRPWLAVPEWRYFDEQHRKARGTRRSGRRLRAAASAVLGGRLDRCDRRDFGRRTDPTAQRAMIADAPAEDAARWLEELAARLWPTVRPAAGPVATDQLPSSDRSLPMTVSVVTLAGGRPDHLRNLSSA